MNLDEVDVRRQQVQYAIDNIPFYTVNDFLVRTTQVSSVNIVETRGVRPYRPVTQGVGMIIDIPLSHKTDTANPYTQGMYVVYDEEMSFPYSWFEYTFNPEEHEEDDDWVPKLVWVRPGGLLGRESDTWELAQMNTKAPFLRRMIEEVDIPVVPDPPEGETIPEVPLTPYKEGEIKIRKITWRK